MGQGRSGCEAEDRVTFPALSAISSIAVLAGLQIPFLCTETHELGEEMVASYLYHVHLYHWLETNDYGRFLSDNDL